MTHAHKWDPETGDCDAILHIAGRVTSCAARKCRVPECSERNVPPLDYCAVHRYLARRPVLPSKGTHA